MYLFAATRMIKVKMDRRGKIAEYHHLRSSCPIDPL
jgi:hypothetical protein